VSGQQAENVRQRERERERALALFSFFQVKSSVPRKSHCRGLHRALCRMAWSDRSRKGRRKGNERGKEPTKEASEEVERRHNQEGG